MSYNNYIFVKNEEKYFEFIRNLRNDDELVSGFIEQAKITREQQRQYMATHKDKYYISLLNDEPVGFIGVVDNDVRLAVKKEFQRKGIASFMLQELSRIYESFGVQVKEDNITSIELFKKNGFIEVGTRVQNNQRLIIMEKGKDND
ncbi:MAG: hypothetical protein ACD_20C00228G0005 [uncultured bacterium]|nr:MAG: hypothetical protein ACD_20C00228G0005 [uncultured bacterium]